MEDVIEPIAEIEPAPEAAAPDKTAAEEAKFRRLFEKADKRLKELEAAEDSRKQAAMSDLEKANKRAEEAEARASELARERLLAKIAKETGVSDDALEFLTGADEETLRAQAQKLATITTKTPITAGTKTQPAASQTPSLDEQIAAAEKAGHASETIRLKMAKWREA